MMISSFSLCNFNSVCSFFFYLVGFFHFMIWSQCHFHLLAQSKSFQLINAVSGILHCQGDISMLTNVQGLSMLYYLGTNNPVTLNYQIHVHIVLKEQKPHLKCPCT